MEGWIKIHRQFAEWEWYDDLPVKILFLHLLLTVDYTPMKHLGNRFPAGTRKTGRIQLSKETQLSQQQIRTALKKLESTKDITITKTPKGSYITLSNWGKFQNTTNSLTTEQPESNQRPTTEQPESNQRATTSKEEKKRRKKEDDDKGKIDSDVLVDIEILKTNYLQDERLLDALLDNQKWSKDLIAKKLTEFNKHLTDLGNYSKKDNDYKSHFLHWMKKKQSVNNAVKRAHKPTY